MGWSYKYLTLRALPGNLRERALQDPLFRDLTETAAKARAFEKLREKKWYEAYAHPPSKDKWLSLLREKPEDPLVAEFVECDDGVQGELPIYCILFYHFDNAVIVQYSSAYFDVHSDWSRTAVGLLWRWGCRGEVIMVAANSVCDDADINIFTLDDKKLSVKYFEDEKADYENEESMPYEKKYARFKGSPIDLMKSHDSLLNQTFPDPFLVLGIRTAELKNNTPNPQLHKKEEIFNIRGTEE